MHQQAFPSPKCVNFQRLPATRISHIETPWSPLPSPLDPDATVTVAKAGYVTNVDGPEVRSGPPMLGADTDDILAELGYEPKEIEGLRNTGVI